MSLNERLHDKTILVTAASAGIGRASALRMAKEGANVIATDIDERGLASLAQEGNVRTLPLDVTDPKAIAQLAAKLDPLDVLFNCAGIVPSGTVLDCTREAWDKSFSINVTACFTMIQSFLPGMLERGRGSIINMASVVSS